MIFKIDQVRRDDMILTSDCRLMSGVIWIDRSKLPKALANGWRLVEPDDGGQLGPYRERSKL
jgi:hypothetical protein